MFVPRAKNDVYREGNYVYISRLHNHYCPVDLLESYIHVADIDPTSTAALFRQGDCSSPLIADAASEP